jgi:PAS domain-containing protein
MLEAIQTEYFDDLPQSIVIVKNSQETLNHKLVYLNDSFRRIIGWNLEEIPDKEHWWHTAYPDPQYQKVVERLWEVSLESMDSSNNIFAVITVNIMTKHNGVKRFKVYTELKNPQMDGYYVVTFEETIT